MNRDPRRLAISILRDSSGRGPIEALHRRLEKSGLEVRDRGLVTELVYGVLRQRGLLDYYIGRLSRHPLDKLDDEVVWILRTGLYQMEFLRIPDRAAVHESVGLCRTFGKSSAAGFVNALLRRFRRDKPELPQDDSAEALAVRTSHPAWLVRRYLDRFGLDSTLTLLERNNRLPQPALWVNSFRIDVPDFCARLQAENIPFEIYSALPNCLLVSHPAFSQHPLYQEGFCFFMDIASQEVALMAGAKFSAHGGDFCAAPGNKAFLWASLSRTGRIICSDASGQRLSQMRERARLCAVQGLEFLQADAASGLPFAPVFDLVLLDVPCSGLGTLRSNPDIRWKIEPHQLPGFQARQLAILRHGFAALRKGGEILYSTCSTEPEENEEVIEQFIRSEPRSQRVGEYHRTFPQDHPGDGFFAARIRHF